MGYETKLIVVDKYTLKRSYLEKEWSEKIAEINMCKLDYRGPYRMALANFRETDCYYYADDGNTIIFKDKYGEPLKEITLPALIKILKKENQNYWRIPAAIQMLEGLQYNSHKLRNLRVLHFGY